MSDDDRWIPSEEWAVVDNVPLVSVDLVAKHDGGVLLGRHENEPAKGEWFVPGGGGVEERAAHRGRTAGGSNRDWM